MLRTGQTSLAIGIRHRRQITPDEFKVRAELDVIGRHFEHAQMQICDGREGATSHEQQRCLLRVIHLALQAKLWKNVVANRSRSDVRRLLVHIVTLPADHFRCHGHRRRAVGMEEDIIWEEIKWRCRLNGRSRRGGLFRGEGGASACQGVFGVGMGILGEVGRIMERRGGGQRKENSPGGGLARGQTGGGRECTGEKDEEKAGTPSEREVFVWTKFVEDDSHQSERLKGRLGRGIQIV